MVSPGMPNMQMLNFNNILNVKDSRWLQLEVCREFQRNKCTRPDTECKFAHPPVNVEVQNGRVTACYDSIKGRCNREKPPCKYFHPPQHLKDQLLINGRNHLALKNAFMTQIQGLSPGTQLVHGTLPVDQQQQQRSWYSWFERNPHQLHLRNEVAFQQPSSPYLASIPTMANFNPYIASSPVMTVGMTEGVGSPLTGVVPQAVVSTQKAFPGMGVPYKRPAPDKSGMPVYQPSGSAAYQQALMQQLGGQSYVPVSCEYGGSTTKLLALPPPNADASPHSPPAIHNAASSSAQSETPSSSSSSSMSSSTTTPSYSTPPYPPPPSFPGSTLSSSSSSIPGKASSLHVVVSSSASPSLPATPVNVISYTGLALNKGLRPPPKAPTNPYAAAAASQAAAAAAAAALSAGMPPSQFNPGAVHPSVLSNMGYGFGMGMPQFGVGVQMPTAGMPVMAPQQGVASGIGGFVQGMQMMPPNMGGVGTGMPASMVSPQLVYSQYPSSSVYLPQLSALSNNPQISWAQAGEQPYKKLKTS